MLAIRAASERLGRWRLTGCTVYVTLEPCPMCAGALQQARIDRLVYGAPDPKAGAVGSLLDLSSDERLNHRFEVTAGVLEQESADLLRSFFGRLRAEGGGFGPNR
jgi:tRNA(adenine34) deaminase